MRWLTELPLRLRSLLRGASVERELDEELGFHIDQQIEEYLAAGMSPSDARAAALRLLGGRAQLEEESRDMRRVEWLEQLVQDLRHASRMLRRSPTFTIVTVMSLALGIGANTAIFSVIEAVLLRPLPYAEPERLVSVTLASPQTPRGVVLDPEFAVWRLENRTLASIAAWNDTSFNVTGSGDAERVFAAQVNADFFHVLAVQPVSGRGFSSAEDQRADSRVAILGYDLWQRRFGGDPTCVGRAITLNDSMYSIAGVLPRTLRFPGDFRPELFVPGGYSSPPNWNAQTMGLLHVIGRLRPHVTPEQARTELEEIQRRPANDLPASSGA